MISALRPAGALLAALAAWGLALLVLAVAGLGGRVGPHPENATLAPPLPVVTLDTIGPRLGPSTAYLEVANRPLLNADRRPPPVVASSGTEDAPLEADLTSVLITADLKLAILQGRSDGVSRRVRLGDVLEGTSWRLVEIEPRRAMFDGPQGRRTLELRVFDGNGGAAPTSMAAGPEPEPGATAEGATPRAASEAAPASASADGARVVAEPTPEQTVESIRRRIEARRAQRAAEGAAAEEAAARERAKQVE